MVLFMIFSRLLFRRILYSKSSKRTAQARQTMGMILSCDTKYVDIVLSFELSVVENVPNKWVISMVISLLKLVFSNALQSSKPLSQCQGAVGSSLQTIADKRSFKFWLDCDFSLLIEFMIENILEKFVHTSLS